MSDNTEQPWWATLDHSICIRQFITCPKCSHGYDLALHSGELAKQWQDHKAEIERLRATIKAGAFMRMCQKQYFKNRSTENLIAAKAAEQVFDNLLTP